MFLLHDAVATTPDYNSPAIFFSSKSAKTSDSGFYFLEDDFYIPIYWEMIANSCPILKKKGSSCG
jgi:hypothetical protein